MSRKKTERHTIRITLILVAIWTLTSCADKDVDLVKNLPWDEDPTLSYEQVFKDIEHCKEIFWGKEQDSKGRRIVYATCGIDESSIQNYRDNASIVYETLRKINSEKDYKNLHSDGYKPGHLTNSVEYTFKWAITLNDEPILYEHLTIKETDSQGKTYEGQDSFNGFKLPFIINGSNFTIFDRLYGPHIVWRSQQKAIIDATYSHIAGIILPQNVLNQEYDYYRSILPYFLDIEF